MDADELQHDPTVYDPGTLAPPETPDPAKMRGNEQAWHAPIITRSTPIVEAQGGF